MNPRRQFSTLDRTPTPSRRVVVASDVLKPTSLDNVKAALREQFGERNAAPVTLAEFGLSDGLKRA